MIDPIIRTSIESYIKPDANPVNKSITRADPAQSPLIPSIILKAFITPTTQNMVIGIP